MSNRSYIVLLPVRVYGDSAELARDHLARIADKGEVQMTTSDGDGVIVVEAYDPEIPEKSNDD